MRYEVEYEFADVKEGLAPAAQAANPRAYRNRMIRGIIGWIVFASATPAFIVLIHYAEADRQAVPPPPQELVLNVVPPLLPGLALMSILFLGIWMSLRQIPARSAERAHQPAAKGPHGALAAWLVLGLLSGLLFFWLLLPERSPVWHPTRLEQVAVALAPLVLNFLLLMAFAGLYHRWHVRRQWLGNPGWRRRTTWAFDEQGVRLISPISSRDMRWECIVGARETERLLVLRTEEGMLYMFPKRFVPEGELPAVRAVIHNNVPGAKFLVKPTGFPVAPITA